MPDLIELTRATACYSGEWNRNGEYCRFDVWAKDPDATVRKVDYYGHGGAETNWEDTELNTNANRLMLVNELNAAVIGYDVSPGFFQLESGEDFNSRDVFHKQLEHVAAISRIRTMLSVAGTLPNGMTVTTNPALSMQSGESSGGYDAMRAQFLPARAIPTSLRRAINPDARFGRDQNHLCNIVLANIAQGPLSQFCEYVTSTSGDTTYLSNGTNSAGATTLVVDGDSAQLYRANRIAVSFATFYVSSGVASGATLIPVSGDARALKRGDWITFVVAATTYEHQIQDDYAGGSGSIKVQTSISVTIPASTAIGYRQELVVKADHSGSGSISVYPSLTLAVPDNTPIVLLHAAAGETYGAKSWAQQYLFSSSSDYVWRSDDASGRGFPMDVKRLADVDYLFDLANPRVHQVNLILTGASANSLVTSDLTGERSFLSAANFTPGVPAAHFIDLHSEHQAFWIAYWLRMVAFNMNVALYAGNKVTNANSGDVSVPWNLGTNADFSSAVLKAYLQARGW